MWRSWVNMSPKPHMIPGRTSLVIYAVHFWWSIRGAGEELKLPHQTMEHHGTMGSKYRGICSCSVVNEGPRIWPIAMWQMFWHMFRRFRWSDMQQPKIRDKKNKTRTRSNKDGSVQGKRKAIKQTLKSTVTFVKMDLFVLKQLSRSWAGFLMWLLRSDILWHPGVPEVEESEKDKKNEVLSDGPTSVRSSLFGT